jgi:F-type H+-transporting ATPase subunit b
MPILAVLAAAAGAEKKGGLPQLDPTTFVPQLVWLVLTFGLLYLILSQIALPRVAEVLDERAQRIKRDLDEAERLKSETERALASYEQALTDARSKAGGIAKETREKLAAEVDRDRGVIEGQLATKLTDAERRIGDMKARALTGVAEIASDTAGVIVEKLSGRKVSLDEIRKALASASK